MLRHILDELETASGSLSLGELSRKLDITPSALEGMINYWVRKGRLRVEFDEGTADTLICSGHCGLSCPGSQQCPFTMKLPRAYSLVERDRIKPDKDAT